MVRAAIIFIFRFFEKLLILFYYIFLLLKNPTHHYCSKTNILKDCFEIKVFPTTFYQELILNYFLQNFLRFKHFLFKFYCNLLTIADFFEISNFHLAYQYHSIQHQGSTITKLKYSINFILDWV